MPSSLYVGLPLAGAIAGVLGSFILRRWFSGRTPKPQSVLGEFSSSRWDSWAMENSDKFLLAILMLVLLGFTLHVIHDSNDTAQVQFFNGLTNTISGALITLVTGSVTRKTTGATVTKDPDTGKTTGVTTVKDEEK